MVAPYAYSAAIAYSEAEKVLTRALRLTKSESRKKLSDRQEHDLASEYPEVQRSFDTEKGAMQYLIERPGLAVGRRTILRGIERSKRRRKTQQENVRGQP